jgi:hypothetical protein
MPDGYPLARIWYHRVDEIGGDKPASGSFAGIARAFCSQTETLGVAQMQLKQTDRSFHRFRETMKRSISASAGTDRRDCR